MLRYAPLLLGIKWLASSTNEIVDDLVIFDKYNKLKKSYRNPKYPVVLCHGLSGFDRLIIIPPLVKLTPLSSDKDELADAIRKTGGVYFDYWYGIKDALEANGCTVIVAKVPPFGSIEERATTLNNFIEEKIKILKEEEKEDPNRIYNEDNKAKEADADTIKVNLIAHSMGGLDSRYLISKIDQKRFQVMSLTTIATPHHGSVMANYVTTEALSGSAKKFIPQSIYELTTGFLEQFNREVPNDPNVRYFSYGAKFKPNFFNVFYYPWQLVYEREGDNDGLVSVKSSHWGKYLGTLDNVDHLDSINWSNTAKHFWSTYITKKPLNFNAVAFYLDIIDQLAEEGL